MRIKRQNGDVLVHLGPKRQAYPEELIRQRRGHNGCTEYLIRWNIFCLDNDKENSVETSSVEGKKQTILMWMSSEDIYANCPTLLGKTKPKEQAVEQNVSNLFPPEDTLDEASLAEMKADVRNLVQRASWQLASIPVPQSSILNTIHILSAYASIGSLMTIFKETGALTLLMKMLCNEEKHIRCSAGKMLRALACHDAESRAYVLLSLSQQDGIEQHMDFDSRYTLLELFAETTSSEEHYISFEGIPLPQIPGKLLFSLVKRYLCATSLMDKLNNITEWRDEQEPCMASSSDSKRKKRMQCEFDFSMAMAHFISELIQVMGWNQNQELHSLRQKKRYQSIFQHQIPTIQSAAEVPQKENCAFKLHSAFPSRKNYVEYVRETLVRGMHVRMLENYEKVCAGDEGEFLQSNNGTPPVQVYWESLGRTYWVHWHMIEIVGSSRNAEQKAQEKVSTLRELLRQNTGKILLVNQPRYCQPLKELYTLPCLTDHLNKDCGTLSQAEWWELLFFINKLEVCKHQEVLIPNYCAVVMCSSGIKEALSKVLEKHSSSISQVTELRDLMNNCEKPASLYQKMTATILSGCIQMVLNQIEEHRHSHQPINVPFFDVFLHYLCHGCSTEVKEDKCWERVEVSSNSQQTNKLVDGNIKTYWESNGTTGSHYINVYMHHGVIIQQMSLLVASEDSSYMPARIIVMAGDSSSSINTKLNMVNVPPLSTRVILLENLTRFWPIIQIKIKRCQQGGIDTRVRGIEVMGPKPTFWPIFREQLCQRTHLFYATKAHTWCQEISADQMQLLQLFNRLNSALCHEELFADRFLPDDEAGQVLGKTCWESLITPLVQRITSPGPDGTSPLSWLLSQYLENLEVATSQTIAFNSRVRRLSHLLVHVDSSGPEPIELMSPIQYRRNAKNELRSATLKAIMKKSTTLISITQCWKDVVLQQVKQFLKSFWQAPDFVERYCSIYQHLRTAMEELFGQKMSFLLALRDGFSEGLVQLPFSSAAHVSEKFAQYIDQWIRDSWTDSTNTENVQHLQQSLEPISFLAELELANIFEHFYRYYLGERLLSLGNTWLESAVVEQIGLCFPSRYPQQMLKNLSELEQQQQEFHLFQLQQLDKHFLEVDQQGSLKEEGEVNMFCSQMMQEKSFSQEAEVKVLLLSPFCWAIPPLCYLKDPIRFFPSSLSQHLSKFADFYIQSQSRFGLEHTKPSHLQWTCLGHAELEYQGCILQVSTLQMYILLCFNSAQVLASVPSNFSISEAPEFRKTHISVPLRLSLFLLGILRLNEEVLGHVSGQRLCLLPKSMYLNVEEKICHALEEKRNFICCLLNQILNEEQEIHIDSLVFKVIDACHKQRHGSPSSFLGNICSSVDVLSCILYLRNQGFVQRQENFPQLLQCVCVDIPTPAVPENQPQVVFQTMQIKKVPSMPCMEKKQTFSTFR
uniref:Cullin 7 n=1 Tax=Laticauda laticaudata TaxID=8630 RepID=A0A8C5REF5_LATLA